MKEYSSWWYDKWLGVTAFISKLEWTKLKSKMRGGKPGYNLTEEDHNAIKAKLASGYYIILTNRKSHLSSYLISILSILKTGTWSSYSHCLMNLDLETDENAFDQFKLMEATNKGVHTSSFMDVFDCDSVCLLQPKNVRIQDWEDIMAGLATQLGKKYDNLFNISDDTYVSCVEMVLDSLRFSEEYHESFPDLERRLTQVGNLTPQMYRDCTDFEVVMEIRR